MNFAKAALASGHEIYRLFFYGDGVHSSTGLQVAPQDEPDLAQEWAELVKAHQLDAVVCIAAALKRGILNTAEAQRYSKRAANLNDAFELAGLGQLVEAVARSDRVLTFGG